MAQEKQQDGQTDQHDDGDAECASSFKEPARKLTTEQLQMPTIRVFAAKLPEGANPNDKQYHYGKYSHLRTRLDYGYHIVQTEQRQILQDSIIEDVLSQRTEECTACTEDHDHPMALFTAGAMASGKGHTLRHYLKEGKVSLPSDFIWVDPDAIARRLPERDQYLQYDQTSAPEKLHPEAALLQEILTRVARERRQSMVIDGSLSDAKWFEGVMEDYRKDGYVLEIFFVFAELDVMKKRAHARAQETGRQTDDAHIEKSAREAPRSVQQLAAREHVHRVRLINNSDDDEPPRTVYDSNDDPEFRIDGQKVDVAKYVGEEHARHLETVKHE